MRDQWTDERFDDFRGEVNRRFDEVDRRFDEAAADIDRRFDEVDRRFDKVEGEVRELRSEMNVRFDGLQRVTMLTGGGIVAALLGVIGTQI